jgi:hypothetical protein
MKRAPWLFCVFYKCFDDEFEICLLTFYLHNFILYILITDSLKPVQLCTYGRETHPKLFLMLLNLGIALNNDSLSTFLKFIHIPFRLPVFYRLTVLSNYYDKSFDV